MIPTPYASGDTLAHVFTFTAAGRSDRVYTACFGGHDSVQISWLDDFNRARSLSYPKADVKANIRHSVWQIVEILTV